MSDPIRDPERLALIRRAGLLDADPEPEFDRLTRLLSRLIGAPVALVSIVDEDRQVFKSSVGLEEPLATLRQTPLSYSFCQHVVSSGQPLFISDAREYPLVRDNPAVRDLSVIAYAGIPLITTEGYAVGTLCAAHPVAHEWTEAELSVLADLAAIAINEIELRITVANMRRQDEAHRDLLNRTTDAIITTTLRGIVTFWNAGAESMFGIPADAMIGQSLEAIVPARHRHTHRRSVARLAANGPEQVPDTRFDITGLRADGTEFPVELSLSTWRNGEQHYFATIMRDVTDRKRSESVLSRSLAVMRATLDSTADGILALDTQGRAVAWNRRYLELWRIPEELLMSRNDERITELALAQVRDRGPFLARLEALANDPEADATDTIEFTDGRVYERYSRPQRSGDTILGRVWSFRDVTARNRLEAELTHQAFHDVLTGLANRGLFRDRAAHALARAEHPSRVAALFLDLDDFKTVNDSLGHLAGDQLLMRVAERLRAATRPRDTVARLGGDEFAVLLEDVTSDNEPIAVAEAIAEALSTALWIDGRELTVNTSIGVSRGAPNETVDVLLRSADLAMYMAKRRGKKQIACYEPAMHATALEHFAIGNDLRPALERGELSLVFQPIIHLASGRLAGAEALLRWNHPTRGSVPPSVFVPIAEEVGLVIPIGRWVLHEACRQGAAWQQRYGEGRSGTYYAAGATSGAPAASPPTINVNVSGRQLQDPSLAGDVASALEASGLAPERLVIEITESVVMQDTARALETLHRLKALGVQIAIDDFGTGYSSLSYLQRFPVDVLKIDKSFVADIEDRWSDATLARTILALGNTLGLRCVAEGIETEVQRDALRAHGCTYGQGYLFSEPVPFEQMVAPERPTGPRGPERMPDPPDRPAGLAPERRKAV